MFISDVPTPERNPPSCVSYHPTNVRACDTSLSAAVRLPDVKSEELELAAREHVEAVDPTSWFCTATICPAIVDNMLVYRDVAHMQPVWSRFIAPLLADAIVPVIGSQG